MGRREPRSRLSWPRVRAAQSCLLDVIVLRRSVPLSGPRANRGREPRAVDQPGRSHRVGGVTPVEVRHGPAVKTRSRGLSPRGAGRAVGGIRAWAENSGRRASSCSTVLLSRAFVCADVKAVVRELLGSAVQSGCLPTAGAGSPGSAVKTQAGGGTRHNVPVHIERSRENVFTVTATS
jgi:hypothetical protein